MPSTPRKSLPIPTSVLQSPKTPVKKTCRAANKDLVCLVCGISLIGERCTFNVRSHEGLLQKIEKIVEEKIDTDMKSIRTCRPCCRKMELLDKKNVVLQAQLREVRTKFAVVNRGSDIIESVKRLSKGSPSSSKRKKSRTRLSSALEEAGDINECCSPLPLDDAMDCLPCEPRCPTVLAEPPSLSRCPENQPSELQNDTLIDVEKSAVGASSTRPSKPDEVPVQVSSFVFTFSFLFYKRYNINT